MDKVTGFEIPVDNMKRAQKFLKSVFGWQFKNWKDEYAHIMTVETNKHWIPKEKGAVNGGMYKMESKSDKPAVVVTVPSVAKYLEKAKKAGGKIITGKQEAGEWGFWAEIADTEGNIYQLWEEM
jgi:predicted enzyme related to lactoylglutathione lyase